MGRAPARALQVLGAMGPPGGARNAVDPRFTGLFSVFEVEAPSTDSLRAIYGTILGRHLSGFPDAVGGAGGRVGVGCLLTGASYSAPFARLVAPLRLTGRGAQHAAHNLRAPRALP